MSSESFNKSRIAKNTLLLYMRMALLMIVGLYTSRVVLQTLGISDYGIYNVVGGFVSMIAYMNTVFVAATQRFMSYSLGKDDSSITQRVFSTAVSIHLLLALVILLIAETAGLWFVNTQLVIDPSRMVAANWCYQCSILSLIFTILGIPYNASIVAHEHMDVYAFISIFDAVAKLLIVFVLKVIDGDKLILYSIILVIIPIIDFILYFLYCRKKFSECHYTYLLDKPLLKEMSSYAGWTAVGTLGFTFKDQALNIILNSFFGTAVNAARGVAMQVNGIVNQFSSNFFMAVTPQITKQYASGNIDNSINLVYSSAKFAFFLLALIIIPLSINMDSILALWLVEVPKFTNGFLQVILISTLIGSLSTSTSAAIQATGNIRNFQIGISLIFLSELPIAYILLKQGLNPYYAVLPSLATQTIGVFFRFHILQTQVPEYDKNFFVLNVILRPCLVVAVCFIAAFCIRSRMENTLLTLISSSLISILLTLGLVFTLGLNKSERTLAITYAKSKLRRK